MLINFRLHNVRIVMASRKARSLAAWQPTRLSEWPSFNIEISSILCGRPTTMSEELTEFTKGFSIVKKNNNNCNFGMTGCSVYNTWSSLGKLSADAWYPIRIEIA